MLGKRIERKKVSSADWGISSHTSQCKSNKMRINVNVKKHLGLKESWYSVVELVNCETTIDVTGDAGSGQWWKCSFLTPSILGTIRKGGALSLSFQLEIKFHWKKIVSISE